jgi:hypothetical protein
MSFQLQDWLALKAASLVQRARSGLEAVTPPMMRIRWEVGGAPSTHRMQTRQSTRMAELRSCLFDDFSASNGVGTPGLVQGLD